MSDIPGIRRERTRWRPLRLLLIAIFLFPQPSGHALELPSVLRRGCDFLYALAGRKAPETRGYPAVVRRLDPDAPHTIHDLPKYLDENLGTELVASARKPGREFVIVRGGPEEIGHFLSSEGWRPLRPVPNPPAFHRVDLMVNAEGKEAFVITKTNGEDRLVHISSLLRLAHVPEKNVRVVGRSLSYTRLYEQKFRELGYVPDYVVYGNGQSISRLILEKNHDANGQYLAKKAELLARRFRKGALLDHELDSFDLQAFTFADGRRLWVFNNEYGDKAGDLVEALRNHGVREVFAFGTAGSPNPELKVGQLVMPGSVLGPDGVFRPSPHVLVPPGMPTGTYSHVSTPNIETKEWAAEMQARKVDIVEVEVGRILERLRQLDGGRPPSLRVKPFFVISDVLNGPETSDYTKFAGAETRASIQALSPHLDSELGRSGSEGYKLKNYEVIPFVGGAAR